MNSSRALLAAIGFAAAMSFTGSAAAQMMMSSVYLGGSIGQSDYKDCTFSDCKDTAWRILGGYQFNSNFSAELGYHNLGEASDSSGLTAEGTAWEIVGVGTFPLENQFSVYGKLGLYRADLELSNGVEESNNGVTFGFGARYDFSKTVGVRLEWQRYSDVGGSSTGEGDIDVLGVAVIFKLQ
jgi:OmpA-OmpF porin, OOP family